MIIETFQDRLVSKMKENRLKQIDLVKVTGVSKGTVSNWVSGKTEPESTEVLKKLAEVFQVSVEWLITGEQPSLIFENFEPVKSLQEPLIRKAPILNYVQAGGFTEIGDDSYDEYEFFIDNPSYGKNMFWLRLKGDSMNDRFLDGDLVLIDADKQAKAGDFVIAIVADENKATFKKLKLAYDEQLKRDYCQLIALNDFYAPIDSRRTKIIIRGVAVEHKQPL